MTKFYAIGIKFGDNDFYNTFVPLLNSLSFDLIKELSKEQLVFIINNLSYGMYLANQVKYDFKDPFLDKFDMKGYLQIDISRLLLNEEVDEQIRAINNNRDFFYRYVYSDVAGAV